MNETNLRRSGVNTSLGLATIVLMSSPALPGMTDINMRPINSYLSYSLSTPSTYWVAEDLSLSYRKTHKVLRFLKRGRNRPDFNHDHFLSFWG